MSDIRQDIQDNKVYPFGHLLSPISQFPQKHSVALLSLNVTIDSVTIHKNGDSNDIGKTLNTKFTFDVLKPFNVSKLIATAEVPVENVTMVDLRVSSATAAIQGQALQPVKVPSDEL